MFDKSKRLRPIQTGDQSEGQLSNTICPDLSGYFYAS